MAVGRKQKKTDMFCRIKKVKDKSTCFQLDPFHRNKVVKEKVHNKKAMKDIMELLAEEIGYSVEEVRRYMLAGSRSCWGDTIHLIRFNVGKCLIFHKQVRKRFVFKNGIEVNVVKKQRVWFRWVKCA